MFTGSIVALITPMDDSGNVCRASLKRLIEYHIVSGTSAIVVVGTTGESATLSRAEQRDVVAMTLEFAGGRIPVIVGTGSNATAEAVTLTKQYAGSGVAACLTVVPYYNRPGQQGLYQHFSAIAQCSELPQILYNVPARTACDLLPETVARLAENKNIIGIKEATGNLARVSQIQALVDNDFLLLSGDDATALDFMQRGGKGVISVTANIAAREMAMLCQLASAGKFSEARRLNQQLMPLHEQLFTEPNPVPVKWVAKQLNLIATDTLRLPMTPLSVTGQQTLAQALKQADLHSMREN